MKKYLRETLAVAQRILVELWCRRRSLIFWAIFPVVLLVLNSLILQERVQISLADAYTRRHRPPWWGRRCFLAAWGAA
jgi:ABC-2 type transport system permease protein